MVFWCNDYFVSFVVFFFNDTATTEIYTLSDTLSLHDALPIFSCQKPRFGTPARKNQCQVPMRSEEHTSELQSPLNISYAVFCLKKKKTERPKCSFKFGLVFRSASVLLTMSSFFFFFLMIRRPPRSTR